MPDTFIYPTSAELQLIAQDKLPVLTLDDPIFAIFPIVNVDAAILMWEQRDNYAGLQQVRGLGGSPSKVQAVGGKRYTVVPGAYGEFMVLDELELTTRRAYGSFGQPIDVSDMAMERQDLLLNRRIDRYRYTGWTLATTGTFSAANADGTVEHTDTFALQTYTASIPWSTHATATPLADLRAMKLLARGHSVSFGRDATLYINQTTANDLLLNTNANDLYGRRTGGFGTFNTLAQINEILAGDDLPTIEVYDGHFLSDATGTYQLFIGNGKGVLVGQRPQGQAIGDMANTRNANNPDMGPGAYQKIIDRGEDQVPRRIEVHDGANFAPRVYFPSALVKAQF